MFPARYFPNRMFAPRYWAKVGAEGPAYATASSQGAWFTHACNYLFVLLMPA